MKNESFKGKNELLLELYAEIPYIENINYYLSLCFINSTSDDKIFYRNLNEADRKYAFLSYNRSNEEKDLFKKRFTEFNLAELSFNSLNNYLNTEVYEYRDLKISSLSIEIINYIYFEYFIDKSIDNYINSSFHVLTPLEEKFTKFNKITTEPKENIEGVEYTKLYHLIETKRKEVNSFIKFKFESIRASSKNKDYSKEPRHEILSNLIDGEKSLKLFYKFEEWLVKNDYLDKDGYKWIDNGGKSSFMRFYWKCYNFKIIKQTGKWEVKIRVLSDLYKIDGVVDTDYGKSRCREACSKGKTKYEFKELDYIQSQHNLNS